MADIAGWRYYNYAMIPNTAPHEETDTTPLETGEIWRCSDKKVMLARWADKFDCGYETQWWYVIKDTPFDIGQLKAKRRYEINKGKKNFDVKRINPKEYLEELYKVQTAAYSVYPKKYRPKVDKLKWQQNIRDSWGKHNVYVFGAFFEETKELCGYCMLSRNSNCINFEIQKTAPKYEKYAINAAIVAQVLAYFDEELRSECYICDGTRNIQHATAFQDYLEKYFGFRKAYCRLNIEYNPRYKLLIRSLYLFKGLLKRLDNIGIVHKINGVLYMEELVRKQKRR